MPTTRSFFQKWTNELVRSLVALHPALNGRHPRRRRQRRRWANAIWTPNGKRRMIACVLSVPNAIGVSALSKPISKIRCPIENYGNKYVLNNVDRVRNCGDHYVIISAARTEQTQIYGKPKSAIWLFSSWELDRRRGMNSQIVCMLMIWSYLSIRRKLFLWPRTGCILFFFLIFFSPFSVRGRKVP